MIKNNIANQLLSLAGITAGAFLAAVAIAIFLAPNHVIDGGVVGISMIGARLFGKGWLSPLLIMLNVPFVYLAYRYAKHTLVWYMLAAVLLFATFLPLLNQVGTLATDPLEIIVIGGAILGIGAGLIIRSGGCLDGTEILAILINRHQGYTVGQVVLAINAFIFTAYGWIFRDWHIAFRSLMTYIVAFQMIDLVIMGLDELKSVLIISCKPKELSQIIGQELGIGMTIMHGRGGFSGENREIMFIIVERLALAKLKEIIIHHDPCAFMAVENLHEVVYGKQALARSKSKKRKRKEVETKAIKLEGERRSYST